MKSEIAHESKIAIVIKLVRLAAKRFYELPERTAIGGNLTKLGSCFAGFVTADARQPPMAEDHLRHPPPRSKQRSNPHQVIFIIAVSTSFGSVDKPTLKRWSAVRRDMYMFIAKIHFPTAKLH